MKNSVSKVDIIKVKAGVANAKPDLVSVEEPLEIRLTYGKGDERQKKSISITMRTPGHDFELALGFLYTEGIIGSHQDIKQIRYCTEPETNDAIDNIVIVELDPSVQFDITKLDRHFYTTSSCGVCGKASIEAVQNANCPHIAKQPGFAKASTIHKLPALLRKKQSVFEFTGGIHGCAFFSAKADLLISREDVGRHNALDKLIGASLAKDNLEPNNYILLLSGRISFELVQKAAMAGVPVIAAGGAPASLAVQTAQELGISLIGFLRDNSFNIYTHPERIDLKQ